MRMKNLIWIIRKKIMFHRMKKAAEQGNIVGMINASLISKEKKAERIRKITQMELSEKAFDESIININ